MKTAFFQKSKVNFQNRAGSLKNRFQYLGFLNTNNELTCDPGELSMHEGMKFHGTIVNDLFEEGELVHVDGIKISGIWFKNRLTKGTISLGSLTEISLVHINERDNSFSYLTKNNNSVSIKDGLVVEFAENQNNYKLKFVLANRILSIHMTVVPIQKFKKNSNFDTMYLIRPSLYLTKTVKVANSTLCFESFANFKLSFSMESRHTQSAQTVKTRVVVYTNGNMFYGKSSFATNTKEPNWMNGILVDLDEYYSDKRGTKMFPQFERFMYTNGQFFDKSVCDHRKSVLENDLIGGLLENLLHRKSVFNYLFVRMTKQASKNFEWKNWTVGYWKELVEHHQMFVYKSRLSKPVLGYGEEKELKKFDWSDTRMHFA